MTAAALARPDSAPGGTGPEAVALAEKLERHIGMLPLSRDAREGLSRVAVECVVAAWLSGRDQGVRMMLRSPDR